MSDVTMVIKNEIKGTPMFTIAKLDDDGAPALGQKFVVNIGIRKAKAILENVEELKKFVERVDV